MHYRQAIGSFHSISCCIFVSSPAFILCKHHEHRLPPLSGPPPRLLDSFFHPPTALMRMFILQASPVTDTEKISMPVPLFPTCLDACGCMVAVGTRAGPVIIFDVGPQQESRELASDRLSSRAAVGFHLRVAPPGLFLQDLWVCLYRWSMVSFFKRVAVVTPRNIRARSKKGRYENLRMEAEVESIV